MIKQISLALLLSASIAVSADDHSNATPGPVETWNCVLNEGKTIDDVRKVGSMVADVAKVKRPCRPMDFHTLHRRYGSWALCFDDRMGDLPSMGSSFAFLQTVLVIRSWSSGLPLQPVIPEIFTLSKSCTTLYLNKQNS